MTAHSLPSRRAVFLDRDGVINRSIVREGKPYSPRSVAEFRLLPGTAAAVRRLRKAGFLVIVVTNQPDVGNGFLAPAVLDAIHVKLQERAATDDIMVCPHAQNAGCDCRKPRPGMLLEAARRWNIDLKKSFMVGDRAGDCVAGLAAGCYTIFIDRGYREPRPERPDKCANSLPSAVEHILSLVRT
jgi:D-glycero-D-manno-heptose 1,7-bisphosphate phosphatase